MRFRRSYLWALVMLLAIGGWLASGILMRADVGTAGPPVHTGGTSLNEDLPSVRVATLSASERRQELTIRGHSEAVRRIALRAETAGRVTATPRAKGATVKTGAVLCQLEGAERQARLAEARAAVDQAALDHRAATQLMQKGYSGAIDEASRKARLDAARAAMKQAEIEIERTQIRAPFDGVIEERDAEVGSYLRTGDSCATLVELDPMLIVGPVSERDVGKLSVGMEGQASLVTGETVTGRIRYIGPSAERATRTFRVEFEAANPKQRLRDGVTAELRLPLAPIEAHLISPATLTLDDDGVIGVRTVDEKGEVGFAAVEIIADNAEGVWVTGLPDRITVIIVGQEYVRPGQIVRPVYATAEASK